MDKEAESKRYREAADALNELAKKFKGWKVHDDLAYMVDALHAKAAGRRFSPIPQ